MECFRFYITHNVRSNSRATDSGLMMQLYSPLEFLFSIAAFTTLAENFLPQLIALPKVRSPKTLTQAFLALIMGQITCLCLPVNLCNLQGLVQNFVRSTLSLTFVIAAARVVFNIKARMTRETTWSLELKGELTKQRRVEAVDKLLTVLTLLVASVFGLQAIGLDGAVSPVEDSCVRAAPVQFEGAAV